MDQAAPERVMVVAAACKAILVRRQLAQIDPALCSHILLETLPRNTAAAVGMAIGIGWYAIAVIGSIYAVIVPRIPHVKKWNQKMHDE